MKRRLLLLLAAVSLSTLALLAPAPPASADGPCIAVRPQCDPALYVYDPAVWCCYHPRVQCRYCEG